METETLLEAWDINNRIDLYLLAGIDEQAMYVKAQKGKAVAGHFTHIHNVRRMWLSAAAPELAEGVEKLEPDAPCVAISAALEASGAAIRELLRHGLESGRIKSFKPSPAAFFGYMTAHEGFHRGQIELTLRQIGFPLDDKVAFGVWEWGVR